MTISTVNVEKAVIEYCIAMDNSQAVIESFVAEYVALIESESTDPEASFDIVKRYDDFRSTVVKNDSVSSLSREERSAFNMALVGSIKSYLGPVAQHWTSNFSNSMCTLEEPLEVFSVRLPFSTQNLTFTPGV